MAVSDLEPWASCLFSLEMGDDLHSSASCHYRCSSLRKLAFCLNGFLSGLEAHDLVCTPVEFRQSLALVFLEFIPERGVRSYPGDYCHHHPILLWVMYCCQLIVETFDVYF